MDFRFPDHRKWFSRIYLYLIIFALSSGTALLLHKSEIFKIYPLKIKEISDQTYSRIAPVYFDINNDGFSELFRFTRYSKMDVVEYFSSDEEFIDVIRTQGNFLGESPSFIFGDVDSDTYSELYIFTLRNDSILLNGFELMGDDGHFLVDFLIDHYYPTALEINDVTFIDGFVDDLESRGTHDLVFCLRTGYSLKPRKIYTYNCETGILKSTENSGAGFVSIFPGTIGSEHNKVIISSSNAIENYNREDKVIFNDNCGWLIVYNSNLTDTILVRKYPTNKSYVYASLENTSEGPRLFAFIHEYKIGRCYLERINFNGEVEKSIYVCDGKENLVFLNVSNISLDKIAVSKPDTIFFYDHNLRLLGIETGAGNPKESFTGSFAHLSANDKYLIFGDRDQLILRDSSLKVVGTVVLSALNKQRYYNKSIKEYYSDTDQIIALSIATDKYLLKLSQNYLFKFRIILSILLFFSLYLGFYLIFRLQNHFYNKRFVTQNKIAELQLQTVQNQLQPHFTFNVLNTIGSMIYKNSKEEAYE